MANWWGFHRIANRRGSLRIANRTDRVSESPIAVSRQFGFLFTENSCSARQKNRFPFPLSVLRTRWLLHALNSQGNRGVKEAVFVCLYLSVLLRSCVRRCFIRSLRSHSSSAQDDWKYNELVRGPRWPCFTLVSFVSFVDCTLLYRLYSFVSFV